MADYWERQWRPVPWAESNLPLPLGWRKPVKALVDLDLFAEEVLDDWIDRVFAVMALAPQHTFLVLTKRAQRMRDYFAEDSGHAARYRQCAYLNSVIADIRLGRARREDALPRHIGNHGFAIYGEAGDWPLPNVWLGVSAEDQPRADERIPLLLGTPAAKRFVSLEPLLSEIDIRRWLAIDWQCSYCREYFTGRHKNHCTSCGKEGGWSGSHRFNGRGYPKDNAFPIDRGKGLDWIIAGGESGPNARPMHPDWPRAIRDQCQAAEVPFFFKQHGEWLATPDDNGEISYGRHEFHHFDVDTPREASAYRVGKARAGRLLDGVEHSEFPA